jgi:uncharacterized protein (TIGR00159 family)
VSPVIRWQDIADIIIMSFLVYHLYGWFRHTKAFQVVIGLGSLGVVYMVTKNLGFFMTSWILQELGTALFVLIIVIFQAEIRQALYRISPLRSIFGRQDPVHSVDVGRLVDAVFSLAVSRTGAIIVFQRTEPIDEYLFNGIPVESSISGELIGCIFKDGSPLHDGALIVRNGRIAQASCHLPLSTNSEIPQQYGTRHRAALGLSERSDAAVVIVSEERGEVSLALSGKLERMETAQQLSTRLTELLFTPVPEAAHLSLVRRMTRNFWPKLATFALVFVCWLVITARQGEITTIAAPVQFHNLPDSLLLGKSSLDSVELQLKTISSLIPLPKEGDVVADIDLSRMQEGNNQVLFRKEDFKLPSGVVITRIKPAGMRVVIEKRMRKLVRVEARFTGAPADNLRLKRYKVSPSMVMVEGPASILSQLESLRTEEISLDVPAGARTMEKRLAVPAQLRALYDDQVKVRIVIGK